MSVINTGSFAKALYPGVSAWYGKAYAEYPEEHKQLFDQLTSSRAWEEDVGTSGFGLAAAKTEGGPISYDSERQGFTTRYRHVTYALGFVVTREAFEDDLAFSRATFDQCVHRLQIGGINWRQFFG